MNMIVRLLLLAVLVGLFPASAQNRNFNLKPPAVTGNVIDDIKTDLKPSQPSIAGVTLTGNAEKDMQAIVKRIQDVGRADLNYAILKAKAANTNGSNVRLQCLNAILAAKDAAEGVAIKDASGNVIPRPDPALVTTIEDVAELVDALSPQGPLMTGCAGAAQLFKTNTLAAINAIVTGAAGIAALPAGL